jgi:hypothetical protein
MECDEPFVSSQTNIGMIITFDESMTGKPCLVVCRAVGAWQIILKNLNQDSPIITDNQPVAEVGGNVEGAPKRRPPDQWVRRRRWWRRNSNSSRNRSTIRWSRYNSWSNGSTTTIATHL